MRQWAKQFTIHCQQQLGPYWAHPENILIADLEDSGMTCVQRSRPDNRACKKRCYCWKSYSEVLRNNHRTKLCSTLLLLSFWLDVMHNDTYTDKVFNIRWRTVNSSWTRTSTNTLACHRQSTECAGKNVTRVSAKVSVTNQDMECLHRVKCSGWIDLKLDIKHWF